MTVTKNPPGPAALQARFNVPPDPSSPFVVHKEILTELDLGWISVCFGRDPDDNLLILALTPAGTFQLAPATSKEPSPPGLVEPDFERKWVYIVDHLPEHFLEDAKSVEESQAHYCAVAYGIDRDGRSFLCLAAGLDGLFFLFRDPASRCTCPWTFTPEAVALFNGLHLREEEIALEVSDRLNAIFDEELEQLMAEIESEVGDGEATASAQASVSAVAALN